MKLAKKIVFLLFLAILLIVCLFISNKLSSNVHQQQTSYLQSLREKKVLFIDELAKQGITAEEDDRGKLVIIDPNIRYEFDEDGIEYISINKGWIKPQSNYKGEIYIITLGQFSGIDTIQLIYSMKNLDNGKKKFLGDLPIKETNQRLKKEVASNEEIREVVKKAETYEKKIKKIVETIK